MKYAIGGVIALFLLYVSPLWPGVPEPVEYTRVIVQRADIEANEPDTVVRWLERVKVVTPPPRIVAIAPSGATELVANFCTPSLAAVDTTVRVTAPRLLLRSGSLDRGGLFRNDQLVLTGPTSHGDLYQGTWETRGDASWVAVGDSVLVRHDRWQLLKDIGTVGLLLTTGYYMGGLF